MKIRVVGSIALTAMIVTACSDSPPTSPRVSPSAPDLAVQGDRSSPINIHRLRTDPRNASEQDIEISAAGIQYHGGPIIVTPRVSAIYWSNAVMYTGGPAPGTNGLGAADGSLLGHFMRNLGASPYWAINNTYTNAANQRVAKSLGYTQFWAANVNVPAAGSAPGTAKIKAIIELAFTSGKLTFDPNTVYAVFTGPGVNLGGGFGSQYCAYHTFYTRTNGSKVKYAAQPYNFDFPNGCTKQGAVTPNSDPAADAEANTLAHELEEAATDPQLNAWFDAQGNENADKCAWTFGTQFTVGNGSKANMTLGGKNFLIQRNWKIATNGSCKLS